MMRSEMLYLVAWVLVIIGGINWLLFGLVQLDVVAMIFGASLLARLVYILIGIGACYLIYLKVQKKKPE